MRFTQIIILSFMFCVEPACYSWCRIRDVFSLTTPSTINDTGMSSSNNLREDIFTPLRQTIINEKGPRRLMEYMIRATQSELDCFIFTATLNQLISEDGSLLEKLKNKISGEFSRETFLRYGGFFNYLFLLFLGRESEDISKHAHFSKDQKLYYYDIATALNRIPPSEDHGDFNPSFTEQIIHELFFRDNGVFLLRTIKDAIPSDEVFIEDIRYPIKVIGFQGGIFQNVILILTTLKDGRIIPFTLLVARSFGKSKIVDQEFANLYQHRHDPYVVKVFQHGFVDQGGRGISAYSSEFINLYGEVNYNSITKSMLMLEQPGCFTLNSLHPMCRYEISHNQFVEILAGIAKLAVHFYDPISRTQIARFSMRSGDVMLEEISVKQGDSMIVTIPLRNIGIKLIAWRGNRPNVDIPHFLDYLFTLDYLYPDRNEILVDDTYSQLIIGGILGGLRRELIETKGKKKGLEENRLWLELYLTSVLKGDLPENSLFTVEQLQRYIESTINPLLQKFL